MEKNLERRESLRQEYLDLEGNIATARQEEARAVTAQNNAIDDKERAESDLKEIAQRRKTALENENIISERIKIARGERDSLEVEINQIRNQVSNLDPQPNVYKKTLIDLPRNMMQSENA